MIEIKLKDGKLSFDKTEQFPMAPMLMITRVFLKENDQCFVRLSMWDDMEFNAYAKTNAEILTFNFNESDPLFTPLQNLLGANEELKILDDDSLDENIRTMTIKKQIQNIVIEMQGNLECNRRYDRYKIFIKNIAHDNRSRDENNAIKLRLIKFFKDAEHTLLGLEQNQQILDT